MLMVDRVLRLRLSAHAPCVMSGDVILARTGVRLTGARHRTTGGTNTLSRHGAHKADRGARPGPHLHHTGVVTLSGAFRVRGASSPF